MMRILRDRWDRWAQDKREMYRGGRPNEQARKIHRRFVAGPQPRLVPFAAALEVTGRTTGRTIKVPLVTVRHRGHWYVVSMLGDQTNWVLNLRAADGHAVLTHGRRRPVRLTEVPADQRAPIIRRYLLVAIGARPHVDVAWNAPLADIERHAHRYPVFRISPVDPPGEQPGRPMRDGAIDPDQP